MIDLILIIDRQITNVINLALPHNYGFDLFFSFLSLKGSSLLIWVLIIIGIIVIEEYYRPGIQKRDLRFVFYFLLIFVLTYIFSDIILKGIFQRPRPLTNTSDYLSCPKDFSFPSTHAATAFASAMVLAFFDKKRRLFYFSTAILISLSRIYLYCHFFLDILIGGLLGILLSKFLLPRKKI